MRSAQIKRTTAETAVEVILELDKKTEADIKTGCGFLDHMLTLLAHHGRFGLTVKAAGDVQVDYHHLTEDVGIVLGSAFLAALGEKRGINRYGEVTVPMDEALVSVYLDISGRAGYYSDLAIPAPKVGDFDTELVDEFMAGLCRGMGLNLHIEQKRGRNSHHIIEAAFKALGRALRSAVAADAGIAGEIPSSKGTL